MLTNLIIVESIDSGRNDLSQGRYVQYCTETGATHSARATCSRTKSAFV